MRRVAESPTGIGTTFGVGELVLDALDEGAFSIILGHDEPLAADAGLGAAQALLRGAHMPRIRGRPNHRRRATRRLGT